MSFCLFPRCQAALPASRSSSFLPSKPLFLLAAFLSSVARRSGNEPVFYMGKWVPVSSAVGVLLRQVHGLWCMDFAVLVLMAHLSLGLLSCSLTAFCVLSVLGQCGLLPHGR